MDILLSALAGALWRRGLGGGIGGPRWAWVAAMALLTGPFWLALPYMWAALAVVLSALFFVKAHTVEYPFLRYGPFGLGYWAARKYWPDNWRIGRFLDGWTAVGELFLGWTFWGTVAILGELLK